MYILGLLFQLMTDKYSQRDTEDKQPSGIAEHFPQHETVYELGVGHASADESQQKGVPRLFLKNRICPCSCLLSFSSGLGFPADHSFRFPGATAGPFPVILVLASFPRQVARTAATSTGGRGLCCHHPHEEAHRHVGEFVAVGGLAVVELVVEHFQGFIGYEVAAAFPVIADTVRNSAGAVVGILRKRYRALCPDRSSSGNSR